MSNSPFDDPDPKPSGPVTTQRGYPLSLLFLVTTICAVMAGGIQLAVRHRTSMGSSENGIGLGAILGAMVGLIVGIWHVNRNIGMMVGVGVGGCVGTFVGACALVDESRFGSLYLLQTLGALGIVVLVSFWTRHRESP